MKPSNGAFVPYSDIARLAAAVEDVSETLCVLVDEIRKLRVQPPRLQEDAGKLEALLSAIHEQIGAGLWPVSWVLDAAEDTAMAASKLAIAVEAVIGVCRPENRGVRLGGFLSRQLGVVGHWRLELIHGRTRAGNVYRVTDATVPSQPSHGPGDRVK